MFSLGGVYSILPTNDCEPMNVKFFEKEVPWERFVFLSEEQLTNFFWPLFQTTLRLQRRQEANNATGESQINRAFIIIRAGSPGFIIPLFKGFNDLFSSSMQGKCSGTGHLYYPAHTVVVCGSVGNERPDDKLFPYSAIS